MVMNNLFGPLSDFAEEEALILNHRSSVQNALQELEAAQKPKAPKAKKKKNPQEPSSPNNLDMNLTATGPKDPQQQPQDKASANNSDGQETNIPIDKMMELEKQPYVAPQLPTKPKANDQT
jgi:hypothetical protein